MRESQKERTAETIIHHFCHRPISRYKENLSSWREVADYLNLNLSEKDIEEGWDIIYGNGKKWSEYKSEGGKNLRLKALGSVIASSVNAFKKDLSGRFEDEVLLMESVLDEAKSFFNKEGVYLTLGSGGYKKWWQFWK